MSMLFGKKSAKATLPDLPPANYSGLPAFPTMEHKDVDEKQDKALPAFPDSPSHNTFSQAAIKDAVGEPEHDDESDLPEFPSASQNSYGATKDVGAMDAWKPTSMKMTNSFHEDDDELSPAPSQKLSRAPMVDTEYSKPRSDEGFPMSSGSSVYVKLDKFHLARRTLREVQEKLEEVDSLIKRVRETKMREEQELTAWEKDIAHIKTRVKDVHENIFEKVE